MVKIIFLLLFFNVQRDNDCIDTLVNKAFDSSFKADYILFLPVETTDGIGRLMITKENLRKYMIAADSSFLSNDIIKDFVKRVINKKQKFYFLRFLFFKTKA